ncbi:MAG: thymidylate kinase [Candidatus Hadarchaeum sp.]|uniref:thymidylate kinase n=1 Tax=Candidatus Hadarchaeum sp. TaxID=2883567 RepID=UPI003D14AB36
MRFIVVDGLDGSGKDTHAGIIRRKYERRGERVVVRSHPSEDNWFGRMAKRALLTGGKSDRVKASFFYALDVIRSLFKYYNRNCDTLIMVRYLMGTAYLPSPLDRLAYKFFKTLLPTSKFMFFLDVSLEECLRRLNDRRDREMFETPEEIIKLRKKALNLAKDGWHILNTDLPPEKVAADIEKILDSF